jgi:ubiquitin-like modifier-activating enzyme ATG7
MSAPSAPPDGAAPATEVLRFEPWQSAVDPTFWAELARRKLDTFGLSEDPVAVDAQFACATHASVSSPAQLDARAFEPWSATAGDAHASGRRRMPGSLVNVNTFERFKAFDRASVLKEAGDKVWRAIASGAALSDPNALNAFSVLAFADLKSWQFSYWFCFPALKLGTGAVRVVRRSPNLLREIDARLASSLDARLRDAGASDAFAWATRVWFEKDASEHPLGGGSIRNVLHAPLTEMNAMLKASRASSSDEGASDGSDVSRVFLSFADACSNPDHPGWALRNLATLAAARFDLGDERRLSVISVRTRAGRVSREHSRVFELAFAKDDAFVSGSDENDENDRDLRESTPNPFPVVGWELNPRGRAGPRRADLGESMDPTRLAVAAAELNLKLMRWRLLPELDLERVTKTKCLLIGAGTLGCAVARTLLGWGVREFTFVDSGRVSFSNPTRQSLFEFADCLDGGKPKAEAAAANLARVFPGVLSRGVVMAVPMPGHPVSGDDATRALADVERLAGRG